MIAYRWTLVWTIRIFSVLFVALSIWQMISMQQTMERIRPIVISAGMSTQMLNGIVGLAVAECLALLAKKKP